MKARAELAFICADVFVLERSTWLYKAYVHFVKL